MADQAGRHLQTVALAMTDTLNRRDFGRVSKLHAQLGRELRDASEDDEEERQFRELCAKIDLSDEDGVYKRMSQYCTVFIHETEPIVDVEKEVWPSESSLLFLCFITLRGRLLIFFVLSSNSSVTIRLSSLFPYALRTLYALNTWLMLYASSA